jgi:hypothetical protein
MGMGWYFREVRSFSYLEKKIDRWFFLPISRKLAREELARRKKEE